MALQDGLMALQQRNYPEAIAHLQDYCDTVRDRDSPSYVQGVMGLARAYRGVGQLDKAKDICLFLSDRENKDIKDWIESFIKILDLETNSQRVDLSGNTIANAVKGERNEQAGVRLLMPKVADSLSFASFVTLFLVIVLVLAPCFILLLMIDSQHPIQALLIAIAIAVGVNAIAFFASTRLMDWTQQWLYQTRWVSLAEIRPHSPEAVDLIQRLSREKKLKYPRLGIIDDQNPTAFTYGSLVGQARLVVSQGLFTYLDADEIAAVYAHEIGHIVHRDLAVMTAATTFGQLIYLVTVWARQWGRKNDNQGGNKLQFIAIIGYFFYWIGTYPLLYFSRTREYHADHFATEVTGNPNGLARALVKIAHGIVQESQNNATYSYLLEGTRAMGIYDPKTAVGAGTAYRIATDSQRIGRIFLWDLLNPWSGWVELNSTHPLVGRRLRALVNYAEQMGLNTEYSMAAVIREGKKLGKGRFYREFLLDLLIVALPLVGAGVGWGLRLPATAAIAKWSTVLFGFGLGLIGRAILSYPHYNNAPESDIFSLMADPYTSPVRGNPLGLRGQLMGSEVADSEVADHRWQSKLILQDRTGMVIARYVSRWGLVGNWLGGWQRIKGLIGKPAQGVGWFRRGMEPTLDLARLDALGRSVTGYPRWGSMLWGLLVLGLAIALPILGLFLRSH